MSLTDSWDMFADIAAIANATPQAGSHDYLGLTTIAYGKAVEGYIGMTGQNPRKGRTHSQADLCNLLADVAVISLCGLSQSIYVMSGSRFPNYTEDRIGEKIVSIMVRAEIPPIIGWESDDMFADIAAITRWLDKNSNAIPGDDAMRVMKIGEEIAEAYSALSVINTPFGRLASIFYDPAEDNPDQTGFDALCKEWADIAITALCAITHFTSGGPGSYQPFIVRSFIAASIQRVILQSNIPPLVSAKTGLT